jgi:hypothetical protein
LDPRAKLEQSSDTNKRMNEDAQTQS